MFTQPPRRRGTRSALLALTLACPGVQATPVEDGLAARCTVDPRLNTAAQAALVPADRLDPVALRALAERSGLAAPAVHAVVVRGAQETDRAQEIARWLDTQHLPPGARCATATHDNLTAVTVVPRSAEVSPLDPTAARGSTRDYAFTLAPGMEAPALVITLPSGAVDRQPVARDGTTAVRFDQPGAYVLQLVAGTSLGPVPLATWHVDTGPGASTPGALPAVSHPRDVLAAVNALRVRAGLSALRADPLLAHVAEDYAHTLATRSQVAHGSAPGDSPVTRLADAHVTALRVAENVARGPTLAAAHARLLDSPSHRANLLDTVVDAAGVGTATTAHGVYLVELLAAHPALRGD